MAKQARGWLASIASIALVGCGREPIPREAEVDQPAPAEAPIERAPLDPAATGSIVGIVVFEGDPPPREPLALSGVGGCAGGGASVLSERLIVADGKLANVLVRVGGEVAARWSPPEASARRHAMTQQGCVFSPHVVALRIGDSLSVGNDDPSTHNVRVKGRRRGNPESSHTQAPGAPPIELAFAAPEVGIEIVCDLHPWMRAWVHALEHPWFAVSGVDGRFEIQGVPAGEVVIETWHEALGKRSARVDVRAGAASETRVVYSAP